jgi:ADP-heptose:LPS heptosyltransferase
MAEETGLKSVLFIRRDNIGDLVCTTPAIRAVRLEFPKARIAVLANTYNAGVVEGNPDVDEVFVYEKGKHSTKGRARVFLQNLNLLRKVRAQKFDAALGCSYSYSGRVARLTGLTGAKKRVGVPPPSPSPSPSTGAKAPYNLPVDEPAEPIHEVIAMMRLVEPLGVTGPPPGLFLYPSASEVKKVADALNLPAGGTDKKLIAFHISSRRPENRWPPERFVELAGLIRKSCAAEVLLLWSPGSAANPLHPGDDELAERLLNEIKPRPLSFKTNTLGELMAVTSLVDMVVCPDGGAMHIAAGLGKPVLAVWGSTDKRRWAPWGVPFKILQKSSYRASSVSAPEAFEAFKELFSRTSTVG